MAFFGGFFQLGGPDPQLGGGGVGGVKIGQPSPISEKIIVCNWKLLIRRIDSQKNKFFDY